jgi:predicted helicase
MSSAGDMRPFGALAVNSVPCFDFIEKTQTFPFYFYEDGERHDNITDWALEHFRAYYRHSRAGGNPEQSNKKAADPRVKHEDDGRLHEDDEITKLDIFHYCYALLHEPAYRAEYATNLKQDLPRIPLRADFAKYATIGKELLELHTGFESVEAYPLKRVDSRLRGNDATGDLFEKHEPKAFCRLSKDKTAIELDEITTLEGLPLEALEYRLGIRSAVEWILDQYRPKKPKDPTIAEKFDNYRFSHHKEAVIELIGKVITVSLKTNELVGKLK